jgi:hypothetical protein
MFYVFGTFKLRHTVIGFESTNNDISNKIITFTWLIIFEYIQWKPLNEITLVQRETN